ncbi:MAG: Fic family protein [Haliscomenobacter sp.]|nr:Fic family protein [Haliscomenobacter sp.]
MEYNWQQPDWPNFGFDSTGLDALLFQWAEGQGRIGGLLQALSQRMQETSAIDIMVAEAVKTSAIEGELLSREDVLSSIRNNLGLNRFPEKIKDKRAQGVARLMVASREAFAEALAEPMLFDWHRMLMEPYANMHVGQWRSGLAPMQVISGAAGREVVHFEAPPSASVPEEMHRFIAWFNQTGPGNAHQAPVRAAIAHVYFESIHPFEDGNGRIGRALSEKALSQGIGRPVILSLSQAIESKRQAYYQALKAAQRSNEITPWIRYFLETILEAQEMAVQQISFTIAKSRFFNDFTGALNPRQEKVLQRMFEAGPEGFTGGMSAKKYMSIAKTSKATATRDLQYLAQIGALVPLGGGRSTRYGLNV